MTKEEFAVLVKDCSHGFIDTLYDRIGGGGWSKDGFYGMLEVTIMGKLWPAVKAGQISGVSEDQVGPETPPSHDGLPTRKAGRGKK